MIYKRTREEIVDAIEALQELLQYPAESHQMVQLKNGKHVVIPVDEEMVEGTGMVLIEEPTERLKLVG